MKINHATSSDLAGDHELGLAKFDTVEFRGRNIRILEDDFGYVYSSAVELKNGDTKWRCSKRNAYKCIAFINTRGDYIVRQKSQHNHDPGHDVHARNLDARQSRALRYNISAAPAQTQNWDC